MDGTFPQGCRPGHFGPEMLNITYFAQGDISERTQARQCPPQNQKRTGPEGSFRFLARPKMKTIANESPEEKAQRERKKVEDFAMSEYRKAVTKGFISCSDRFYQKIMKQGGPEADALYEYIRRRCTPFLNVDIATLTDSAREWEKNRERERDCCFCCVGRESSRKNQKGNTADNT